MKVVRSNLQVLVAEKGQRERRRISLREVARQTGLTNYIVYGFAHDSLREFPRDAITKLCDYLDCEPGDLLKLEEVEG